MSLAGGQPCSSKMPTGLHSYARGCQSRKVGGRPMGKEWALESGARTVRQCEWREGRGHHTFSRFTDPCPPLGLPRQAETQMVSDEVAPAAIAAKPCPSCLTTHTIPVCPGLEAEGGWRPLGSGCISQKRHNSISRAGTAGFLSQGGGSGSGLQTLGYP